MNVLTNLKKLRTSSEFGAAIGDLEREHVEATAKVDKLEAGREAAIFDGGDLSKLARDISDAVGRVQTLGVALDGARKRRDAAIETEDMAELEALADGARKLKTQLRAELIAFGAAAETLAGHASKITVMREEISRTNKAVLRAGHGEIQVRDPLYDLGKKLGHRVPDPMRGLTIAGFWPSDGKPAALTGLKK